MARPCPRRWARVSCAAPRLSGRRRPCAAPAGDVLQVFALFASWAAHREGRGLHSLTARALAEYPPRLPAVRPGIGTWRANVSRVFCAARARSRPCRGWPASACSGSGSPPSPRYPGACNSTCSMSTPWTSTLDGVAGTSPCSPAAAPTNASPSRTKSGRACASPNCCCWPACSMTSPKAAAGDHFRTRRGRCARILPGAPAQREGDDRTGCLAGEAAPAHVGHRAEAGHLRPRQQIHRFASWPAAVERLDYLYRRTCARHRRHSALKLRNASNTACMADLFASAGRARCAKASNTRRCAKTGAARSAPVHPRLLHCRAWTMPPRPPVRRGSRPMQSFRASAPEQLDRQATLLTEVEIGGTLVKRRARQRRTTMYWKHWCTRPTATACSRRSMTTLDRQGLPGSTRPRAGCAERGDLRYLRRLQAGSFADGEPGAPGAAGPG